MKGSDEKNEHISKNHCGNNNKGGHHRNPNNINMNNNGNNGNNGNNNNNNMNGNNPNNHRPNSSPPSNNSGGDNNNGNGGGRQQQWDENFERLLQYKEELRKKQTIGLSDKEREEWKWDGNVPHEYKVRCDIPRTHCKCHMVNFKFILFIL